MTTLLIGLVLLTLDMLFPGWVEFSLFGGGTTSVLQFPDSGPFTIPGSTDAAYCQSCTFGGGRFGTGGTATVSTCAAPTPKPCGPTDGGCLLVSGLSGLSACSLFTAYSGEDDAGALSTSILLHNTGTTTWASSTQNSAGTTNATFALAYNASGTEGCGYYLTVSNSTTTAGVYFQRSAVPSGTYALTESHCDGLPLTLAVSVTDCPVSIDCTSAVCGDFSSWPTAVTVTITDPDHAPTDPLYAGGTHTLILQPGSTLYELALANGVVITMTCGGGGWIATITPPGRNGTLLAGSCSGGGGGSDGSCPLTYTVTLSNAGHNTGTWTVTWSAIDGYWKYVVSGGGFFQSIHLNDPSGQVQSAWNDGSTFETYQFVFPSPVTGCPASGNYPLNGTDAATCVVSGAGSPATGSYTYIPTPNGSEWSHVAFTVA